MRYYLILSPSDGELVVSSELDQRYRLGRKRQDVEVRIVDKDPVKGIPVRIPRGRKANKAVPETDSLMSCRAYLLVPDRSVRPVVVVAADRKG